MSDLRQDEDCLDTWFSSWLWPISLFDGINNPGNEEINYYYPTTDLVTAPDIIFFWVARMIMAGYEYEHKLPFRNVYFTGIVRDKIGRKMSKSLGNSPDALELIKPTEPMVSAWDSCWPPLPETTYYTTMRCASKDATLTTNMECLPLGKRLERR